MHWVRGGFCCARSGAAHTGSTGDSDDEIPLGRWEKFHAAVENLPEEHREVFRLVWYLGADRETAAKNLGLSIRTAGRRWQEARELVAAALANDAEA